jgi:serine/threonine protein kinase/formylglycine-generating enzyme required for sulfatase activity
MAAKTWGDFEIFQDQVLGRGGMGAVYRGRQVSLDRPAAIKVLKKELTDNPEFVKRFHREAALVAKLVDANVVQVFGAGESGGEHFYAMEYVEGEDYAHLVKQGRKFGTDDVLQVALKVGLALQSAWKHRIIHRDIKPSNIIRTRDGEIKLMDFGLAKNPESDLTQSEVIMGTAKYMSPEQATGGDCDTRSDLYSLGVVLYELAAGRPPFVGETPTAVMYQNVHHKPPSPRTHNPGIPAELEALILRLMQKVPEARYPNPEALVSAVRCILDGVTPDEKSTLFKETVLVSPSTQAPAPRSSGAAPLILSLAAAALLLGAGGYFVYTAVIADPVPPADPTPPAPVLTKMPVNIVNTTKAPEPPAWEEPRRKGLDAFGEKRWALAVTHLEEAREKGATDVEERIRRARASELIEQGDAEKDDPVKALERYEAAAKHWKDEDLDRRIRRASFDRWVKSAERAEGGDWAQAAADWERALAFAGEELKKEVDAKRDFCRKYAKAKQSRSEGRWREALDLFRELAKDPRSFLAALEVEVERAKIEVAKLDEADVAERRKEYEGLLELGRAALRRAAWAEAKAEFDRAAEAKYAAFPRDEASLRELGRALQPPPGMAYVPGGKFRMGAGPGPVDGPEGDAETAPFFLDLREVRVSEYGDFLAGLEAGGGHHPSCLKDEPPGKRHVPDSWSSQKPEDAVVNVDWWDAASYAAWARKRLPREAEWERAASFDPSGRRPYAWGAEFRPEGGRSFLGLEGMGTGAIEWTAEAFQKYAWSSASHSDFGERYKALRGGVLLEQDAERDARASHRHWYLPGKRSARVGFRCAADAK